MVEKAQIWLPDADSTHFAGMSLSETIYDTPITITLDGELGAGKTTFLQGFAKGLGIDEQITSPTYALEQRYQVTSDKQSRELIHIDLYRLNENQAKELLESTEDHTGIRCIEWAERVGLRGDVHIQLEEHGRQGKHGRQVTIKFDDVKVPDDSQIDAWRDEVKLPDMICRHCDAVADLATQFGEDLLKRGQIVQLKALRAAARLHDLLRFVDFQPGAGHIDHGEDPPEWDIWKKKYEGLRHEAACAEFLKEQGYPKIASIVEPHGLMKSTPLRNTIEKKLLFYADKRVMGDKVVTVDERFEDFRKRYSDGKFSEDGEMWLEETKRVEEELGF